MIAYTLFQAVQQAFSNRSPGLFKPQKRAKARPAAVWQRVLILQMMLNAIANVMANSMAIAMSMAMAMAVAIAVQGSHPYL
ncbi:MAG: hypothetical protein K2Y39_00800 [Candidatus Obscuribacterales bacterium]|nr:hypothetical protein [Candidatus Obscuribacterales bacterium]